MFANHLQTDIQQRNLIAVQNKDTIKKESEEEKKFNNTHFNFIIFINMNFFLNFAYNFMCCKTNKLIYLMNYNAYYIKLIKYWLFKCDQFLIFIYYNNDMVFKIKFTAFLKSFWAGVPKMTD